VVVPCTSRSPTLPSPTLFRSQVHVQMPQPQVQVQMPEPQVAVTQPRQQPQVQVQPAQPQVQVLPPQGGIQPTIERAQQPQVHVRSEEHTSELQSREKIVCRLL